MLRGLSSSVASHDASTKQPTTLTACFLMHRGAPLGPFFLRVMYRLCGQPGNT